MMNKNLLNGFKMNKLLLLFIAIILLLNTQITQATEIGSLNQKETLSIKSMLFKQPVDYLITLPDGYFDPANKDKKYFVIFDLHPRSQPFISGLHDWLAHNGEWPWLKTIIVTPANYNEEFANAFKQLIQQPNNHALLDYLQADLFGQINQNYRTNGFNIYSGFMGNAGLGLHLLLNRPALFNAYILTSPTLANDFAAITSQADEKLAKLDTKNRFLYISTGKHRYQQNDLPALAKLEQSLTKFSPSSLDWRVLHNEKNYYMSQPAINLINGIELLFDDIHTNLAPDSAISRKGADAIIDYYQQLSTNKYGFAVSAEGSLKALAKSFMATEPEQAIAIYQKTAELYPESAYAHSSLAKAYADTGDLAQAISTQKIAVQKSQSMVPWHQNKHKEYLEEFTQQLAKQK